MPGHSTWLDANCSKAIKPANGFCCFPWMKKIKRQGIGKGSLVLPGNRRYFESSLLLIMALADDGLQPSPGLVGTRHREQARSHN